MSWKGRSASVKQSTRPVARSMAVRTARPLPPWGSDAERRAPRSELVGQRGGVVGAAVVGHQYPIVHAPVVEKRGQLRQGPRQAFLFVVGGNDDRQIVVGRRHGQGSL